MGTPRQTRTTHQKLEIFRSCFSGLQHVYGTYDPKTGRAWQVKKPVTHDVLLRHLQGKQPYGVYLLVGDRTRAVVVDFDEHDPSPPLAFLQLARHYGIEVGLEASKSKGHHLWVFTDPPGVPASKARSLVRAILRDIGKPDTEVFPKQDRIEDGASYGNFINAPLFGALVPEGRTVFVDPDNALRPFPDQWGFLEGIRRTPESLFDEVLKRCPASSGEAAPPVCRPPAAPGASHRSFGLPPCAQRMLAEGVAGNQRLACFRLAGHLRKAGIPEDAALAALMAWAAKNHPPNGKGIITRAEVYEQTRCAFGKQYRGCGCEEPAVAPYCDPSCPLRRRNSTAPGQGGHQAVPPGSPAARQR